MTDTTKAWNALERSVAIGRQIRVEARKLIQGAEMEMRGGLVVVKKSDLDALVAALDAEENAWGMERPSDTKA